jgi:hypothetical protein
MSPDRIIVLVLGLVLYFMQSWIIFAMVFVAVVLAFFIDNERVVAEYHAQLMIAEYFDKLYRMDATLAKVRTIQRAVRRMLLTKRMKRFTALAMGLHPRLGDRSLLSGLCSELLESICCY